MQRCGWRSGKKVKSEFSRTPMKHALIAAALLAALCTPAWAVNKCTGPDGRVVYQDAPCAGTGTGGKIELHPGSVVSLPKPAPASADVAASNTAPEPAVQKQGAAESPLEREADMCLNWYRPKLRDPAGAYYTSPSKQSRVLTMTLHATNGYGGYVTKQATCEIHNGQLNQDWTKIHAQRGGWSVE